MLPALLVIGAGLEPTRTLVMSQVVLSFGLPFALVPLALFTARAAVPARVGCRPATAPEMLQPSLPFPRAAHDGAFPESASIDDQLRFMLNYAVLAPSVMNSQPWRFRVAGGEVFLYADRSRAMPALDPDGRELVISCGAALMNLRLAVRHYGYSLSFEAIDDPSDPDLLAALSAGKPEA